MDIKFKVLLLLPLVVCTGYPHSERIPPYISRMGSLMGDTMLFMMYSGSLNYDAYFFTPALMALDESEFIRNGFLDFFATDFSLREHANDFHFSQTETRVEFAKRFFAHIASLENVPSATRELAAKFAKHFEMRHVDPTERGFIRPCHLYSFVRAVTMLQDHNAFNETNINSVEVIIKFLLTVFNPEDYNIEDTAYVTDIAAAFGHAFSMSSEPLKLTDGSLASQRNKELFERLATEESVSRNVRDAIADILPNM